ncbi:3',5'-cyclic-AMP phosphodiesterase [Imhoffiella purpurea]|uniref:3',5'-cyclic-nucleotide phosphodiesterase n=1 Tax=Imhoffiella purpurea TaxID=1249627 RepID=W9V512_9GAMM|nr:3',5'-cyclic-AMP phosphodiesterase [Imhoffiella purpurea]EXJ14394.1 3',5'-cyclic-nucleotide phosphodiesterase [Imhoffiella purpurea]
MRIIQLTDLHLFADPQGSLLGITTRNSFEAVLEMALEQSPDARAMVITGDLVHDDSPASYRYLRDTLRQTGLPCFCTAGNHDPQNLMDEHLGGYGVGPFALRRLDGWNLIFLDSNVNGSDGGHLAPEHIAQLENLLDDDGAPTLLFMHHHPIPVGSVWMDTMGIDNGDRLIALCNGHPQIKGILFGHIHQCFERDLGGYQVLGSPSTCIQFLPHSLDFALDNKPPGYRELDLHPDGRLTSRVMRLDHYAERPIHQVGGY